MKNETVVKSVGAYHLGNKNEAGFLPVGTRIISIYGETATTEDGQDVFTGLNAVGNISALLFGQEHCYAVDFPYGVSVFLSPAELADKKLYQVIRRVIAHFKPMNQYCDGDLYFDVTDKLLNGWSLFDIQHWEDCNCNTWLLLGNYTEDDGSHYGYVTASIKAYFGVSKLSEITEEMLLVKRAE